MSGLRYLNIILKREMGNKIFQVSTKFIYSHPYLAIEEMSAVTSTNHHKYCEPVFDIHYAIVLQEGHFDSYTEKA